MCDRLVRPDLARNGAPHPRQAVHGACSRVRKNEMHGWETVLGDGANFSSRGFRGGDWIVFEC